MPADPPDPAHDDPPDDSPDGAGAPEVVVAYGRHPSQRIGVREPVRHGHACAHAPRLAVLVHGGWWRARHDRHLMDALAHDLAAEGWRVASLEFRRVEGDDGGWPTTLDDVVAALDRLAPLGGGPPVLVGHSSGGHLALLAARVRPVAGVVALAAVTDLVACAEARLGEDGVRGFLGGDPVDDPDRFREASPVELVPFGVPLLVVHGVEDQRVPVEHGDAFVARARGAGDDVTHVRSEGEDHFAVIDPASASWAAARAWMAARVGSH